MDIPVATKTEFNGIVGPPIYIRIVPVRGTFRTGERTFQCKRCCHYRRWGRSHCACSGLFTVVLRGTQMTPNALATPGVSASEKRMARPGDLGDPSHLTGLSMIESRRRTRHADRVPSNPLGSAWRCPRHVHREIFSALSQIDRSGWSSRRRNDLPCNTSPGLPGVSEGRGKEWAHLNPRICLFPEIDRRSCSAPARCDRSGPRQAGTVGSGTVARLGAPPEVIHRARLRTERRRDKTLIKTACILRGPIGCELLAWCRPRSFDDNVTQACKSGLVYRFMFLEGASEFSPAIIRAVRPGVLGRTVSRCKTG